MSDEGTVSAVIPVYNGETYVAEAIASTLNQTRPPIECIVVDDGSTDATRAVVGAFSEPVVYVRQARGGVSAARNRGARLARGQLVGFLDHDDVWLPTKLERQFEALQKQDAAMALCAMNVIDQSSTMLQTKRLRARHDLVTGMLMFDGTETVSCSSTGLVWRGPFLASGGFDPSLSMSADWDLLLRMLLSENVAYVDEPLVLYRLHANNMSHNVGAMEADMKRAFEKAFADPNLPHHLQQRRGHAYGRLYRMLAGSYKESGDRTAMLRALAVSLRHDPKIAIEIMRRVGQGARM